MNDGNLTDELVQHENAIHDMVITENNCEDDRTYKKFKNSFVTPRGKEIDTDDEVGPSEILVLQNALEVVSNRYAKVKLELDELREEQRTEQRWSTSRRSSKPQSSWSVERASSFLKKHINPKMRKSRKSLDEIPALPKLNVSNKPEARPPEEKLVADWSESISPREKSVSLEASKTDVLLNKQIKESKEELALKKEEIERLNVVFEERDNYMRELKIEKKRNAFEYEKSLQKARSKFEMKMSELHTVHASEKANLETELVKAKERFIADTENERQIKFSQNIDENDGLMSKARTTFQQQIQQMKDAHELAMKVESEAKNRELELMRREIARISTRIGILKRETAYKKGEFKDMISKLRKEWETEKDRNNYRKTFLSSPVPLLNQLSENRLSSGSPLSSALQSQCQKPDPNMSESVESLKKQVSNTKARLELEKQALVQALRNERLTEIDISSLQEIANSLTHEMLEKDLIIKKLKASLSVIGHELLTKKETLKSRTNLTSQINTC